METKKKMFRFWDIVRGDLTESTLRKVARAFPEFAEEANRIADEREEYKRRLKDHMEFRKSLKPEE